MERINVTKTFLPPIEEYQHFLKQIWQTGQLTNQGSLLRDFENQTKQYLGIKNFHFVSNGTIALQVALRALNITEGEIITTPFSYVATTSAILWERCDPVFVDIEPDTFSIDPSKIEAAITSRTKAIMAVHVFGYPCDVMEIERIAKKHNIKVVYDAAHAFGATYGGKSLLSYGDIATCSFHATKLFHTIEGGSITAKDPKISDKIELIKRFGHNGDDHIMLGINAKANEFQAAMGLCSLQHVDSLIAQRKQLYERYNELLDNKFHRPTLSIKNKHNYVYYPLLLKNEQMLLDVVKKLNAENVFPRRYFYPALNKLPYISSSYSCPVAEDIASRVLCLPLYPGLEDSTVALICNVVNAASGA